MAIQGKQLAANVVLAHKAGRVLAVTFTGNPKKATVTFATAFPDTNYAVNLTPVTLNEKIFTPQVETQLAGSFVIHLGTNKTVNLSQVNWAAIEFGESA